MKQVFVINVYSAQFNLQALTSNENEIDGRLFSTFSNQFTFRRFIHPACNLLTDCYVSWVSDLLVLTFYMGSPLFSFENEKSKKTNNNFHFKNFKNISVFEWRI